MAQDNNVCTIADHKYGLFEWYASKAEAMAIAGGLRRMPSVTSVRIITKYVDKRYAQYWVYIQLKGETL